MNENAYEYLGYIQAKMSMNSEWSLTYPLTGDGLAACRMLKNAHVIHKPE